jgi:hypothetical protein
MQVAGLGSIPRLPGPVSEVGVSGQGIGMLSAERMVPGREDLLLKSERRCVVAALSQVDGQFCHAGTAGRECRLGVRQQRGIGRSGNWQPGVTGKRRLHQGSSGVPPGCRQLSWQPGERHGLHQAVDRHRPFVQRADQRIAAMPAARRISYTVDAATETPSLVSSPWIRR